MRTFSMRCPSLLMFLLSCCMHASGQRTDSIRYPNGYLYYHEYGRGTPVIVLSGGPGNSCLQQEDVAVALGKHYRSILLEQRGTGRSVPVPFDSTTITLQTAVDDLNRLLAHTGLKQAIIFGHSWGAMLAMSFAAAYPEKVKALVLATPGYYKISDENFSTHIGNMRARLSVTELQRYDSLEKKITDGRATAADTVEYDRLSRLPYIYNKPKLDSLLLKINAGKRSPAMAGLMISDLKRVHYDLGNRLDRYKGPVYVIGAHQDVLSFYTYDLKILRPSIHLQWIQHSGHFPMFEQPEAFYKALFEAMKAVE